MTLSLISCIKTTLKMATRVTFFTSSHEVSRYLSAKKLRDSFNSFFTAFPPSKFMVSWFFSVFLIKGDAKLWLSQFSFEFQSTEPLIASKIALCICTSFRYQILWHAMYRCTFAGILHNPLSLFFLFFCNKYSRIRIHVVQK